MARALEKPRKTKRSQENVKRNIKGSIMTPLRVILATLLLIFLSFYVYKKFGISDWLFDVGFVFVGILVIILAAFGVVAVLMYIREKLKKT